MTVPGDEPPFDITGPGEVPVDVPDDARELEVDIAAYHHEQRARRRRERVERVFKTRRWQQYGISGPLVALVLLLLAGLGVLLVMVRPDAAPDRPQQAALASPEQPAGQIGGLLPAVDLHVNGSTTDARSLRPSLLVLVPADCGCAAVVDELAAQANQHALPLYLIVSDTTAGDELAADLLTPVRLATDPLGTLATTYDAAEGVTAIPVHEDGVVVDVVPDVDASTQIGPALAGLTTPRT